MKRRGNSSKARKMCKNKYAKGVWMTDHYISHGLLSGLLVQQVAVVVR